MMVYFNISKIMQLRNNINILSVEKHVREILKFRYIPLISKNIETRRNSINRTVTMVSFVRQAQVLRFQGQNSPFPFLILAVCSTPPSSPSILPPPYYPSKKARKMKSSKRKGNDRFFAGILIPAETTRDLFPRWKRKRLANVVGFVATDRLELDFICTIKCGKHGE